MDVGYGVSHGPGDVDVVIAVEVRVDAALQAHLGGAHAGSVSGPSGNLVQGQEVGGAPEVERQRPFREAAEPTLVGAHICVVDIPVGHPGDLVSDGPTAKLVSHLGNGGYLGSAGPEEGQQLLVPGLLPVQDSVEDLADPTPGRAFCGDKDGRGDRYSGVPRRRSVSDLTDLCTVGGKDLLDGLREERPGVVATQPLGVATVGDREMEVRVKPTVGVLDVLRVDGEAGGQTEAPLLGRRTEPIQVWPGSLGIHVVGGDGRDSPPVVDPGI